MSWLTPTVETAGGIDTDSVPAAGAGAATLVDVVAANEGVAIISLLTLAHLACVAISGALSVVSALTWDCHTHISRGRAAIIGIAAKAGVTLATVGNVVDTVTVGSTPRGTHCRQNGRHAQEVSIPHKSLFTEALVCVAIAGSIEAAGGGVTTLPALAGDAGQGLGAGVGRGAGLRNAAASREGVAEGSLTTGTGGARSSDNALGIEATDDSITHGGALAISVLLVAHLAPAPGCVVLRDADGVVSAGDGGAGVDAGGGQAGQLPGAVRVT